jgi:hypothetical protein
MQYFQLASELRNSNGVVERLKDELQKDPTSAGVPGQMFVFRVRLIGFARSSWIVTYSVIRADDSENHGPQEFLYDSSAFADDEITLLHLWVPVKAYDQLLSLGLSKLKRSWNGKTMGVRSWLDIKTCNVASNAENI